MWLFSFFSPKKPTPQPPCQSHSRCRRHSHQFQKYWSLAVATATADATHVCVEAATATSLAIYSRSRYQHRYHLYWSRRHHFLGRFSRPVRVIFTNANNVVAAAVPHQKHQNGLIQIRFFTPFACVLTTYLKKGNYTFLYNYPTKPHAAADRGRWSMTIAGNRSVRPSSTVCSSTQADHLRRRPEAAAAVVVCCVWRLITIAGKWNIGVYIGITRCWGWRAWWQCFNS